MSIEVKPCWFKGYNIEVVFKDISIYMTFKEAEELAELLVKEIYSEDIKELTELPFKVERLEGEIRELGEQIRVLEYENARRLIF